MLASIQKEKLILTLKIFPQKIVIQNGISVDKYHFMKKHKQFNLLCLSAIKPRKGQINIIEVARLLKKKKFKFKLTLAGVQDKIYFKNIRDRIKI